MAKTFPKKLFVKIEKESDDPYFLADETVLGMVDVGEKRKVAIYQLVEVIQCEGMVETSRPRR
jgi:hypothetical protein